MNKELRDNHKGETGRTTGTSHKIMRFSFYFWPLAEIADIYFLWFIKFFSLDLFGGVGVGIELRRAQPIGGEFPTRTLSVCAAGS